MLPDGTLVVPIRDDADGSDDEEELSGIIEVSGIKNLGQGKPLCVICIRISGFPLRRKPHAIIFPHYLSAYATF